MQLGNNNTLGTINYKGTVFSHERNFAHVDFLFLDVLDRLVGAFLVINNQANLYTQGDCVSDSAQLAFLDIKSRRAQTVANIFQGCIAGIADNRKDGLESRVQTDIISRFSAFA